ncbi:MAG: hypothetical protein ACHQ52_14270, partial [Candidatus Eisenbacteria bacterium]
MRHPSWLRAALLLTAALPILGAGAPVPTPDRLKLPPIVFVSRDPIPDDPGAVPGLGPHHRAATTRGRLRWRSPDGSVRDLSRSIALLDVSHPSVSPDGGAVAFGGLRFDGDHWGIYRCDLATGELLGPLDAEDVRLGSDLPVSSVDRVQPCWITDSLLCAVELATDTRTQYTDLPVSRLVLLSACRDTPRDHLPGVVHRGSDFAAVAAAEITPITHERNGAETPAFDPTTGRILYSRWWFNRWRASDDDPRGLTGDVAHAIARDTVNLWQIVSIEPDGTDERVEASGLTSRLQSMGYGPAVLADGSIVATYASNLGLSPGPGVLGIQRFSPRIGHAERLVGAIVEAKGGSDYGSPHGLAAPAACDPVGLPDGRVLFSYAPGGRGDFGLYVMDRDGSHVGKVFDEPGSLELDAAPVTRWHGAGTIPRPPDPPPTITQPAELATAPTFRFFDRDVFAGGHARPGVHAAPPRAAGTRIRFWAALPRPEAAGGDTAVLVREVPVRADGSVDERVPAGVPMFEQLVDAQGRVLRSVDGPAHV